MRRPYTHLKILFLVFCCVSFFSSANGQFWTRRYFPPETTKRVKCYDYTEKYGGLISVELATPPGVYYPDNCLIRIDRNGDTLWTKKNLLNGPLRATVTVLKQMPNGDYLIGVSLSDTVISPNTEIGTKFIRIDSNGNILSSISRGDDKNHGWYMNIEICSDKSYYISYTCDSFYFEPGMQWVASQSVIEKYDSSNVRLWKHRLMNQFPILSYTTFDMTAIRTADDGIFYLTRGKVGMLRADGTPGWEHSIYSDLSGYAFDMYAFSTSDSGIVVSLFDTMQHVTKYNSSGGVAVHIPFPNDRKFFAEGAEVVPGKYLMVGATYFPDSCGFYLTDKNLNKLDSLMTPSWDTGFTHAPLVRCADGKVFYAEAARLSLTGDTFHVFAAKVDTMFNIHRHLRATLTSNCLVPGYTSHLDIGLHNEGTKLVDTTLVVVLDSSTSYSTATITPVSISGDTLRFQIDSLMPDSVRNFSINVVVDSTIGLGTLLTFYAYSPYPNNIAINDDSVVYSNATVSSFDPNFKSVNRSFYCTLDERVFKYTIGYENTGSYFARNIKILDTIDLHLDPSTIRIVSAYPDTPAVIYTSDNTVIFNLPDINLPDSARSPEGCYGQFTYSILRKDNTVLGDTIVNTAHIVFDFNTPVVTNTTMNIISEHSGPFVYNDKDSRGIVLVYPNPSSGNITVRLPGTHNICRVSISDICGKTISMGQFTGNSFHLHLDLADGLYFIRVIDLIDRKIYQQKVVIVK